MNDHDTLRAELDRSIAVLCDGEPSTDELSHLEQLVIGNVDLRLRYLRQMQIHALGERRLSLQPPPFEHSDSTRKMPGILSRVARHVPGGELTVGTLVVLVIVAAFWGLSQAIMFPGAGVRTSNATVATIRDTADALWSVSPATDLLSADRAANSPIQQGQAFNIISGLVEMQLARGATLIVEGPAEWSIDGDNQASLKRGKLVAHVPPEASGFLLETPGATVVDIGTEFGVEVDARGQTNVEVLEGMVDLSRRVEAELPSHQPLRLLAGTAVEVPVEGQPIAYIPLTANRFRRSLHPQVAPSGRPTIIPLGNLFDDARGTSLDEAIVSDKFGATAEIDDVGIECVLYGGESVQQISGGVAYDLLPLGWAHRNYGLIANDRWTSPHKDSQPTPADIKPGISTRAGLAIAHTTKLEDGVGMHPNALLTFDLDELRAACQCGRAPLRFRCDRVGINDDVHGDPASASHVLVLVATDDEIIFSQVNGESRRSEVRDGVWRLMDSPPAPLVADGRFVSVDVQLPAAAKTLTLATAEAGQFNADHVVWSGARLEVSRDSGESP